MSYAPGLTRLGQGLGALLGVLVGAALLTGSRVAYRDSFRGVLDFVGRHPLPVVAGLSLVGAGADLRLPRPGMSRDPRPGARQLLAAGSALLLLLYLLPQRGKPFGLLLGERIVAAASAGGLRLVAGSVLFWALGLLPLFVAMAALRALRRSARPGILLGLGARYGLSGLAALLCLRLLLDELDPYAILLQLRTAVLLGVLVGSLSLGLEQVLRHLLYDPLPPLPPPSGLARDARLRELVRAYLTCGPEHDASVLDTPGVPASHALLRWLMRRRLAELGAELGLRRAGALRPSAPQAHAFLATLEARPVPPVGGDTAPPAVAEPGSLGLWLCTGAWRLPLALAAALVVLAGGLAWRLHEPEPDLAWKLGPATAAGDALFGDLLPAYVIALGRREARGEASERSPRAGDELRRQTSALVAAAAAVDRPLGRRVERIARRAVALDRTGLLWLDAVQEINRRVRELGMPYYVDGNALVGGAGEAGRREPLFYVTTYRVQAVRRFALAGRRRAALHVRRLDRLAIAGARLGMVRDDEPFALVMLDTVEESVRERLDALGRERRCGIGPGRGSDLARPADAACGQALRALLEAQGLDLGGGRARTERELVARQVAATERHELQHQLDGEDLAIAPALFRLAPGAADAELRAVTQELSALLAELATTDDLGAAWKLGDLAGHVLAQAAARSRYRYAAALVVGELLGRPVVGPGGRIDLAAAAELWQRAPARPGELGAWLAPRARAAHDRLVGTPLGPGSECSGER
ncbi:MAG: hypothetical protein HY744_09545 [Deltaproteobacteria bacterium]|nr:hypothetical protein [Deltaproteobacteria bacterium]